MTYDPNDQSARAYFYQALLSAWSSDTDLQDVLDTDPAYLDPKVAHQLAVAFAQAGGQLLGLSDIAGQAFLQLLWVAELRGLHLVGGSNGVEYNSLSDWASACIPYHDPEYVRSMARVVERMFRDIRAHEQSGDPYILTHEGQVTTRRLLAEQNDGEMPTLGKMATLGTIVTPEQLIETPRIIKRLKENSYAFKEGDQGQKAAILGTIIVSSQPETVQKRIEDIQATKYQPIVQNRSDGLNDLRLEGLTAVDLQVALNLLRPIIRKY